jgi:microcin C transport system permease protein
MQRAYLLRRLALIPLTLLAIVAVNFAVIQLAPGGPVQALAARVHAAGVPFASQAGVPAGTIAALNRQFGFDQPPLTRFAHLLIGDLTFHFGDSYTSGAPVAGLIAACLPVSLSLGLWSTMLAYVIAIPLGLAQARRAGGLFDSASLFTMLVAYAVPGFLLAVLLLAGFSAGGVLPLFPLGGLASPGAAGWPWPARMGDYAWHIALPTLAITAGSIAGIALLTRNAARDTLAAPFITAARARGAGPGHILRRHLLPHAALLLAASFPAAFTGILFSSALLIEIVFSLHGLGRLGYEAVLNRDYPVMFATLYIYSLVALIAQLVGDLLLLRLNPLVSFDRHP